MAKPGNITQKKRARERDQQERKQLKREDRAVRKEQKKNSVDDFSAGDPDLAGIVPGPQPPQEY
jgi:hypothetical protein